MVCVSTRTHATFTHGERERPERDIFVRTDLVVGEVLDLAGEHDRVAGAHSLVLGLAHEHGHLGGVVEGQRGRGGAPCHIHQDKVSGGVASRIPDGHLANGGRHMHAKCPITNRP
jgi:hypothetical protein